jgi:hypothetical protein
MFILALFGTKCLKNIISTTSGHDLDGFRTISLVIAVLRLVNECYDVVFKYKDVVKTTNTSALTEIVLPEHVA